MDIIIVGCGKVGFTLVEQLSNEDHNIVVIDEKPEKGSIYYRPSGCDGHRGERHQP